MVNFSDPVKLPDNENPYPIIPLFGYSTHSHTATDPKQGRTGAANVLIDEAAHFWECPRGSHPVLPGEGGFVVRRNVWKMTLEMVNIHIYLMT